MKKFSVLCVKTILVLLLCTVFLFACKKEGDASLEKLDKDTSYAFGMFMAGQLAQFGFTELNYDYQAVMEGFKAFNEATETRMTWDQAIDKLNIIYMELQSRNNEQMWLEGEKNREDGEAYMAENGRRSGVITTSSGLQYEVLSEGRGDRPRSSDIVQVHYEGTLIDGTVFDSSYMRGEPIEFPLDRVIPGWTEGVQLMRVGSTYNFVIPPELGYGPGGAGTIPPNATLLFRVELLSIKEQGDYDSIYGD